jgi:hypothetical protein
MPGLNYSSAGRSIGWGRTIVLPALLLITLSTLVYSAPHPHQGVVKPFSGGDPGVKLDGKALRTLQTGLPYSTQIQSGTNGRGLVVQDVKAPVNVVWGRILDFNSYNKMVPKTAESSIYKQEKLRHGQERIWVRMKVGFPMLKLQFFINHLHDPAKNSLTWTLDYSQKSDLDDSVGFWYVIPHPDNPANWTRVYYSVEVSMFSWVPKFVVEFMSKQALTDATAWVKRQSELAASKVSPQTKHLHEGAKPKGKWDIFRHVFGDKRKSAEQVTVEDATLEECSPASAEGSKIGLTRYGLVSSVMLLVLYNVHLYLSQ